MLKISESPKNESEVKEVINRMMEITGTMPCPSCKGRGSKRLLMKRQICAKCNGTGLVYVQ